MKKRKTITYRIRKALLFILVAILFFNVVVPAFRPKISEEKGVNLVQAMRDEHTSSTERIRCIDENVDALIWRLRMIERAKESIVLSTFDLREDESGTDMMAALYAAAERGVKIQILVDGAYQLLFLQNSKIFQTLCTHENVNAKIYNPPGITTFARLNYRMHDKYLIIDEDMYLLGGRNTNDIFLGDYKKGKNVDREILVYETEPGQGTSFQELKAYFSEICKETHVKSYQPDSSRDSEAQRKEFRERYEKLCVMYDIKGYNNWLEDTISVESISLLTNGTHARMKEPQLLQKLEQMILASNKVYIQTPYVICDDYMYEVLEKACRNAEVRILLNAVEKGSNPWGCTDYLNNKEKILRTGVTIHEVMNEQALHTKTIILDDDISVVGSFNYDIRSAYLDTEMMLVIESKELNAHLQNMCDSYIEKSMEVSPDGTEITHDKYIPKKLSTSKQLFYNVLKVIIRPIRHLL